MENHISQQLLVFVQSILLGLAIGSLYDLLRPFRLRLPRVAPLLDGVYALAVGAGCFRFILARAEGELRGFVVLGVVGGAVLFFSAFSSLLRPVWEFWADTLGCLVRCLTFPLRQAKKFLKKCGRCGKNLFYFASKCYTIGKSGYTRPFYEGGSRHGQNITIHDAL